MSQEIAVVEEDVVQGEHVELTDSEKLEFLYSVALKVDKLVTELAPQIGPLLDGVAKNPMLKMFLR